MSVSRSVSDPVISRIIALVIDTNVWISALINPRGAPASLMQHVRDGRVRLILSDQLLDEVLRVVRRPRIRRRIELNDDDITEFIGTIRERAITARISGSLQLCRDPKDDLVIETAIVGGAAYLVSRDEDLTRDLNLVRVLQAHGVEVLTVARFLERLDAGTV